MILYFCCFYPSIQGDCLPASSVLCSTDPCTRQSVQLRPNGEVHMWRFPRHPASGSMAVGGLRWQPEIQHQVSKEVPRPEEGQQGPEGPGRRPQHQRWNSGECGQIDTKSRAVVWWWTQAQGIKNIANTWTTLSSIRWAAILHDNYTSGTLLHHQRIQNCNPHLHIFLGASQTNAPLFAAVIGLGG